MKSELIDNTIGMLSQAGREQSAEGAIYKQIEADMRIRIGQGQWTVGEMLPSRRELAEHYKVSPLTVERAITGLIGDGLLRADRGRGTFIERLTAIEQNRGRSGSSRKLVRSAATIGVVGRLFTDSRYVDPQNQWVRMIIHSIESACAQTGNSTRFVNMAGNADHTEASLPDAVAQACDSDANALAVIAMGLRTQEVDKALEVLERRGEGRPVVIISSGVRRGRPVAQVYYDNWGSGYEAANHMISIGCRRSVLFVPATAPWAAERTAGALAAAANKGLAEDWFLVRPPDPDSWEENVDPASVGYRHAKRVIANLQGTDWDGVLCVQDQGGHGFVKAAQEFGLAAGVDYAIMGFDDSEESRMLSMSSMRPPFERMGAEAVKLLRAGLAGEQADQHVCLRAELITRASTSYRTEPATLK